MNRKDFLRLSGIAGVASVIPAGVFAKSDQTILDPETVCTLIPSETAGPFPLDLTTNTYYFRQDIRET